MKPSTKIALIVAAALVLLGAAAMVAALAAGGGFQNTVSRETTHKIQGDVSDIRISVGVADVVIKSSGDDTCSVLCQEDDKITYTAVLRDNTLLITEEDRRDWFDFFGIQLFSRKITLYLPAGAYDRLIIQTGSGSMTCTDTTFSFSHASLSSGSGSIQFASPIYEELSAATASGGIALRDLTLASLKASSASGRVSLSDITAEDAEATSSSGQIDLSYVRSDRLTLTSASGAVKLFHTHANAALTAETTGGEIRLDACDAGSLTLTSVSGSITGTLLSDKWFDAKSISGSVTCPPSVRDGGTCTACTTSGRIHLQIQD